MADFPVFEQATTCPFCGQNNEAVTPPEGGRGPQDGDFSMCFTCGEWAIFDSRMSGGMRKPLFPDYMKIATSPKMRQMRDAWVETMRAIKQ